MFIGTLNQVIRRELLLGSLVFLLFNCAHYAQPEPESYFMIPFFLLIVPCLVLHVIFPSLVLQMVKHSQRASMEKKEEEVLLP